MAARSPKPVSAPVRETERDAEPKPSGTWADEQGLPFRKRKFCGELWTLGERLPTPKNRDNISRHRSRSGSCAVSVFRNASDRTRGFREWPALMGKEHQGGSSRTGAVVAPLGRAYHLQVAQMYPSVTKRWRRQTAPGPGSGTVATKMITGIPFPVFVWGFIISSCQVPVSDPAELVFPLPVTGCASSRN